MRRKNEGRHTHMLSVNARPLECSPNSIQVVAAAGHASVGTNHVALD